MINNKLKYPIIAVDWDNTLYIVTVIDGRKVCHLNCKAARWLRKYQGIGGKLILYTCRANKNELDGIVSYCASEGLKFDAINENVPDWLDEWKQMHPDDTISPKPFWHMLIDDTAYGMQDSVYCWNDIGREILKYKENN